MCSVSVCFTQIDFHHMHFFLIMRRFVKNCTEWIRNKRSAPEFHGAILLKPYPVHTHNMNTIGNGMTALNCLPCIVLFRIGFFILRSGPADCSWDKIGFLLPSKR